MDKAAKRELYNRLRMVGLHKLAQSMMDERRKRWRLEKFNASKSREGMTTHDRAVAARAWIDVWADVEPLCEFLEQLKGGNRHFIGYQGDPMELLDPKYRQTDDAIRTHDAYAWLAKNFRLVVCDMPTGTSIDFERATTRPPNLFAVQALEEYARTAPGTPQRRALTDRIQQVLGRPHEATKKKRTIGYAGDDM